MTEKTFYSDAGKGAHRRKEDKKAIEKNWDSIDWSVKATPVEEAESGCGTAVEVEKAAEG